MQQDQRTAIVCDCLSLSLRLFLEAYLSVLRRYPCQVMSGLLSTLDCLANSSCFLTDILNNLAATSGDMGVELGVPKCIANPTELLPRWMQDTQLEPDLYDSDASEESGDWEPDIEAEPRPSGVSSQSRQPFLEQGMLGGQQSRRFMRNALTIPGLQHLLANLSSDTLQRMSHWKTFMSSLKLLESLLGVTERRDRFIWKSSRVACMKRGGTPSLTSLLLFNAFSQFSQWHGMLIDTCGGHQRARATLTDDLCNHLRCS